MAEGQWSWDIYIRAGVPVKKNISIERHLWEREDIQIKVLAPGITKPLGATGGGLGDIECSLAIPAYQGFEIHSWLHIFLTNDISTAVLRNQWQV